MNSRGFVCFSALVIVGDIVLHFSFTENTTNDIIGLISAIAISSAVAFAAAWALEGYNKLNFRAKPIVSSVLQIIAVIPTAFVAIRSAYLFVRFVTEVMLERVGVWLPFITFLSLALFATFSDKNLMLKFSVVAFPALAALIILMFCFSVPFMEVKYILPYKAPDGNFTIFFCEVLLNFVSVLIPILVFGRNCKKRHFLFGCLIGGGLIILSVVNTVAIFGGEFAANLDYSYLYAVSTASLGHIFSRMDLLLYAVCFLSSFVKTAGCLASAVLLFKGAVQKIIFQKI